MEDQQQVFAAKDGKMMNLETQVVKVVNKKKAEKEEFIDYPLTLYMQVMEHLAVEEMLQVIL